LRILEDLGALVSPTDLTVWLRPLQFAPAGGSSLRLEAPNPYHLRTVQDRFGSLLRDTAQKRLGPDAMLEIVVADQHLQDAAAEVAPLGSTPARPDDAHDVYDSTLSRATRPLAAEDRPRRSTPLNSKYTFEHFVVGKSNQFAHAAARAVAEHPGTTYNPLFIFGGSGLGKTHVMQAIGNHILRSNGPGPIVHYSSAESFMNEMIGAIGRAAR
jgi:chromosomal replication initiator protein